MMAVEAFLYAFGDDINPLPETVKVLDEIITEYVIRPSAPPPPPAQNWRGTELTVTTKFLPSLSFIIETCHEAAASASYSRRSKIKVDDFKFVLRRDPEKLGRVTELLTLDKEIKRKRKAFDVEEENVGKEGGKGKGAGASADKRDGATAEEDQEEDEEGVGVGGKAAGGKKVKEDGRKKRQKGERKKTKHTA